MFSVVLSLWIQLLSMNLKQDETLARFIPDRVAEWWGSLGCHLLLTYQLILISLIITAPPNTKGLCSTPTIYLSWSSLKRPHFCTAAGKK